LRECRSIQSGDSGLPYFCAPLVCVSAVIVRQNQKARAGQQGLSHELDFYGGLLLLCPPRVTKATLANIRAGDLRKLAFLLAGTGGRRSDNPKDGPVWFISGGHMRLEWPFKVNGSELDFTSPWRQVRWMRDSLTPTFLPVRAVESGHQETALEHIQVLHAFADRDLQSLIIPHGIMPLYVSKPPSPTANWMVYWYAQIISS